MSMCRVFSYVVGRGCLLWPVCSLGKILLASFCTPRPNFPVIPGVSWLPTFCIPVPYNVLKRHLFWVLVLDGLVGLNRTIQLQLLQHYRLGHRLGLLWNWMVWFGNEQRSFCCFWDCTQVLHFGLFFDYDGYSISSKEFFTTVVYIMVIWVKFTHSIFSLKNKMESFY